MQSLDAVSSEIIHAIGAADSPDALEAIRIDALGKKGRISLMMRDLGGMDAEARKQAGQAALRPCPKDTVRRHRSTHLISVQSDFSQVQSLISDQCAPRPATATRGPHTPTPKASKGGGAEARWLAIL